MIVIHRKNTKYASKYEPSIDSLISNLKIRFKQNNIVLLSIKILLLKFAVNENILKIKNLNIFYKDRVSEKVSYYV